MEKTALDVLEAVRTKVLALRRNGTYGVPLGAVLDTCAQGASLYEADKAARLLVPEVEMHVGTKTALSTDCERAFGLPAALDAAVLAAHKAGGPRAKVLEWQDEGTFCGGTTRVERSKVEVGPFSAVCSPAMMGGFCWVLSLDGAVVQRGPAARATMEQAKVGARHALLELMRSCAEAYAALTG